MLINLRKIKSSSSAQKRSCWIACRPVDFVARLVDSFTCPMEKWSVLGWNVRKIKFQNNFKRSNTGMSDLTISCKRWSKFVVESLGCASWVATTFWPLWWRVLVDGESTDYAKPHSICYHRFGWYATLENKTPAETFPKFPSVLRACHWQIGSKSTNCSH